jgi:hypothetical protein
VSSLDDSSPYSTRREPSWISASEESPSLGKKIDFNSRINLPPNEVLIRGKKKVRMKFLKI